MSEFGEMHAPRPYEALSPVEKVKAILGVVQEPVSKELALDFAGINLDQLNEEERAEVESVFGTANYEGKYMAPAMQAAMPDIDWQSAHAQIADKLWGDLFGEEIPKEPKV